MGTPDNGVEMRSGTYPALVGRESLGKEDTRGGVGEASDDGRTGAGGKLDLGLV